MIALVVTTAELAIVAALGSWTRWLIIHGAIAVIALIVFLAKFGRARRRATGAGNGRGTGGRGRGLGGLFGRRGRGAGGHGRSAGTGGRGRGLGGILGRRGHGTGANAHAPGSRGRGLGGLLGRRGHGAGAGSGLSGRGHGAGGHGRGAGTGGRGLGSLFGGTGSGRGHGTGTDSRGRGLGSLFGGRGHDKDDTDQSELLSRIAQEFKKGWDKGGAEDEDDTKNNDAPDEDDASDEDNEEPAGQNKRNTPANTNGGTRKMVKTQGTPSLQAWGRCLPSIEQALLEKQTELRRVEADLEDITQAVVRLRDQGEQELPASPKLVALLEDVQASLSKLPKISEAIGHVASNANALGPMYRVEHMGDEDRLAGMRGGVEREKRSDVSEAQKDT